MVKMFLHGMTLDICVFDISRLPFFTASVVFKQSSCSFNYCLTVIKRNHGITHSSLYVNGQSNTHVLLPWQQKVKSNEKQEVASFHAECQALRMTRAHSTSLPLLRTFFHVTLTHPCIVLSLYLHRSSMLFIIQLIL